MTFYIKQNDTSPAMLADLLDANGQPVDINGASVRFHMRPISSAQVKISEDAVIVSQNGVVRYDWQTGDTDAIGSYKAEFQVTYGDGSIETFPNDGYIRVEIIAELD
jgi:hypothetical protein